MVLSKPFFSGRSIKKFQVDIIFLSVLLEELTLAMGGFRIDDYQFGKITIAGKSYTKDLIILPARIIPAWWRKEGHLLQLEDLSGVLEAQPQLLVIGQGAHGQMRVASDVIQALAAAGIEWIAQPTEIACQEYNKKAVDQSVAAALHLTC